MYQIFQSVFRGGDRQRITSFGFPIEIMDPRCSYGGPKSNKLRYTKFCEGCTKGSKVHSEVGIGPQSLSYGFLNEIMDHPCSDEGLGSNRIGCIKFYKGCTKFCEGCTKGSKVCSKVGIDPQSLPYGFQNEIMDHSWEVTICFSLITIKTYLLYIARTHHNEIL